MCATHHLRAICWVHTILNECSLAQEPAAWSTSGNERRERARRARACSPRLIERKNGQDRRGGSRERTCAGVVRFGQSSHPCVPGRANLADTCRSTLSRCSLRCIGGPYPTFSATAIKNQTQHGKQTAAPTERATRHHGAQKPVPRAQPTQQSKPRAGRAGCGSLVDTQQTNFCRN